MIELQAIGGSQKLDESQEETCSSAHPSWGSWEFLGTRLSFPNQLINLFWFVWFPLLAPGTFKTNLAYDCCEELFW